MKHHTDPITTALFLAFEAMRCIANDLLIPVVALGITLATPRIPVPRVTPAPVVPPPISSLPVRELRQLARAAGHRALARSGRRQQLLEALA